MPLPRRLSRPDEQAAVAARVRSSPTPVRGGGTLPVDAAALDAGPQEPLAVSSGARLAGAPLDYAARAAAAAPDSPAPFPRPRDRVTV